MTPKRRLDLLPEVLPKPERMPGATGGASSVRSRTLARLSVLAALAAACHGKGGKDGNGGSGAYGVVDPLPDPTVCLQTLPTATASYLENSAPDAGALGGNDAGVRTDAGLDAGAQDAGVRTTEQDAGVIGARRVRVYLDDTYVFEFGDAAPVGSSVQVLSQTNLPDRTTIDLLVLGDQAALDFSINCDGTLRQVCVQLILGPSSVDAQVQRR